MLKAKELHGEILMKKDREYGHRSRRACLLVIAGSIVPVAGCLSPFQTSNDVPGIRGIHLINETVTTQSLSVQIERDRETVRDEIHTLDPGSRITIDGDWMATAGTYEFRVTPTAGDRAAAAGNVIPGDYERGACIDVRITSKEISIYQRLADGSCS